MEVNPERDRLSSLGSEIFGGHGGVLFFLCLHLAFCQYTPTQMQLQKKNTKIHGQKIYKLRQCNAMVNYKIYKHNQNISYSHFLVMSLDFLSVQQLKSWKCIYMQPYWDK